MGTVFRAGRWESEENGSGSREHSLEVTLRCPMDALRGLRCPPPHRDFSFFHGYRSPRPSRPPSTTGIYVVTSTPASIRRQICTARLSPKTTTREFVGKDAQSKSSPALVEKVTDSPGDYLLHFRNRLGVHRGARVTEMGGWEDASRHALQDRAATRAEEFFSETK